MQFQILQTFFYHIDTCSIVTSISIAVSSTFKRAAISNGQIYYVHIDVSVRVKKLSYKPSYSYDPIHAVLLHLTNE